MVTAEKTSVRQSVLQWISDGVESGMPVAEAAEDALNVVKKEGKWGEFALEFITAGRVADDWRTSNHNERANAAQGKRRVDTSELKRTGSLLESLYPVGGIYKRLGDLTYEDCDTLRTGYVVLAEDNSKKAQFFELIAKKLEGGQTVREALDEEQVRGFYEQVHE